MKKFLFLSTLFALLSITNANAQTAIWSVNSREDVLKGDSRGVSTDPNGAITVAPKLAETFKAGQPYVWSTAVDLSGNIYLGTGSEGRIFRLTPSGTGTLFSDLAELNVSALAIGRGGELFAGTSPDGKVYKIDSAGKSEVYFDPKEKYIWSMAVMADGSLAVGTGETGKIYRVRAANASPDSSLLFDTSETHIISLAADKAGNLYAGTDANGLVLRFRPDGKPFALLDSPLREIHELSVGPDGSVYALALGESASTAKTAETPATVANKTVSVEKPPLAAPQPPQKSKYDLTAAKSAVYRISPDGSNDILWSSGTVVGFSLYAHQTGRGVLLGTSDRGRIYDISNEGRETLALQTEAGQISSIFTTGNKLFAASSNQGNIYSIGSETESEGVYESAVLDAKTTANWGSIWWRSSGNVMIETRSGNTDSPSESWSTWHAVQASGTRGQIGSPSSRFVQWRAVLKSAQAVLNEVSLAFANRNISPEMLSISILPPNVGLLANPPIQIDPNIELSGIDPSIFGIAVQPILPRRAYQRGARSFQWTTDDRNGDSLEFDIYYKESAETSYRLLKSNVAETFLTLDGLSLADGRYTLKIVAKDSPSNPAGLQLSGEMVSEPFEIDNTQPIVAVSENTALRTMVKFSARDTSSYLIKAEYSFNGGPWIAVHSEDGISDGPVESYIVNLEKLAAGEYSVTLRVFDANGNIGNARAIVRR